MSTGSGTGTPASGGMTILAMLRDRVEQALGDTTNALFSTDAIDEAIRQALARYSKVNPQRALSTITLDANGREISLATLIGLTRVQRVWWDYDASDPNYPPDWRKFEVWAGNVLFIDDGDEPGIGDVVRIWYTKVHAVTGLDNAESTTLPTEDESLIVTGAAGIAAQNHTMGLAETLPATSATLNELRKYATAKLQDFEAGLKRISQQEAGAATVSWPLTDPWAEQAWT